MLKAAQIFSNNMVLQRRKNVKVWGTGNEGEEIKVSIGENCGVCKVKDGKWLAVLPPMEAGDDYEMKISDSKECLHFTKIAIGEVWFLGGQSNMELELQNSKDAKDYLNGLEENFPVRYYYTPKVATAQEAEQEGAKTCWSLASSENSKCWSAVGFHFAAKLSRELGVIVGLIGCNWGGTSASCWVDKKTLENDKSICSYLEEYNKQIEGKSLPQMKKEYDDYVEYDKKWYQDSLEVYKQQPDISWEELQNRIGKNMWPGPMNEYNPFRPANMFENMVMRVCPYTIKGFLYYQGESDDHKPDSYYRLFTSLINLWREKWGDMELPFIMVQLPAFKNAHDPDYKHWCKIRNAQMKAFKTVKNTAIAVITDCGEFDNIHPTDKKPVGERLCLQAQKLFYGMDVQAFGPLFRDYKIENNKIRLYFDYTQGGFSSKGILGKGFEIAGEDGEFFEGECEIQGEEIVVSSAKVENPRYVRYNWYNYMENFLTNQTGIPLAPFNTMEENLSS